MTVSLSRYAQNSILLACAQGPHLRRYYEGWAQFVKMCRQWDGVLVVTEEACVNIYFNFANSVTAVERGKQYDLSMQKHPYCAAVAVTSLNNTSFEGRLRTCFIADSSV